ncbi:MAG: 50S ribosomal protein L29 [Acidobacteriaceae bacterium]
MEMDKIVNLDAEELVQQERQAAEQVFRLRFQMRMGQNEGLKKLRELKKDIARFKTVQRQRELAVAGPAHATEAAPKRKAKKTVKKTAKGKSIHSRASSKKSSKDAVKAKKAAGAAKTAKRGKASAKRGS